MDFADSTWRVKGKSISSWPLALGSWLCVAVAPRQNCDTQGHLIRLTSKAQMKIKPDRMLRSSCLERRWFSAAGREAQAPDCLDRLPFRRRQFVQARRHENIVRRLPARLEGRNGLVARKPGKSAAAKHRVRMRQFQDRARGKVRRWRNRENAVPIVDPQPAAR